MHVFVRPSPILAPFVESLWYVENYGQGWERVLPSGGIQLLVNLYADELWSWNDTCGTPSRVRGAALEGPRSAPILIDTAGLRAMIGVAFRPGGIHPFFAPPASAAAGELVELTELWGQEGELLRERLLEAASPATKLRVLEQVLIARAVRPLVVDRPGAFAVAALDRGSGQNGCRPARHDLQALRTRLHCTGGTAAEAVRPHPPVSAPATRNVRGGSHGLGAVGGRVRLLRPGPYDPRLPSVLGDEPKVLHPAIGAGTQPRAVPADG